MFRSTRLAILACLSILTAGPAFAQTELPRPLTGIAVDTSGAPVAGARVTASSAAGAVVAVTMTGTDGAFLLPALSQTAAIAIAAPGFVERTLTLAEVTGRKTFVLQLEGVHEAVTVEGAIGYRADDSSTAMRAPASLRDTPQAVSIVTRSLIADQRMRGLADVVRYMPGVGIAQGEGNRDTVVLRGNQTTADYFVDGIRDDVQYVRDLYNVERVEAIKGPNAMVFGRGGAGGVINRVTRQAGWARQAEMTLDAGAWGQRRVAGDAGADLSQAASARITGVYEDSESYRDGVTLLRYGANPTAAFRLGPRTVLRAGYEYFHDERTADRGVSSFNGRPLDTRPGAFFGDPTRSPVRATINVATMSADHLFNGGVTLRNRLSYGDYDKFYQNVYPGSVNGDAGTVQIQAYNNATRRQNLFNQADLVVPFTIGASHHALSFGVELARQATANFRNTGYFTSLGPSTTSVAAPLTRPTIALPIEFRQSATDADNDGIATTAAIYAQDQIALTPSLKLVVGLRVDRFQVDVTNNRSGDTLSSRDTLWSPRAGIIYRPASAVSLYGNYSLSHLPRAGEQLSSLTATNRTLDPEAFRNYEVGAIWEISRSLALTTAAYRLSRSNVAVVDPADATRLILVDAQRTRGLEIGLQGKVTSAWSVAGGYALQGGEITRSLSASVSAGASLAQLPTHSFSLWNRYQLHARAGAGLGLVHRGASFSSTDNRVMLPGFTRADAALFVDLSDRLRAQVNVENLFDAQYFAFAHSNTNITPGSPRALRVSLTVRR